MENTLPKWSVEITSTFTAAQVTKTLADVASNLSAVYLELGRARDALDHAKMAVDMVPKHEKALFRVAKAAFLLGDFDQCQERLDVLPEDPAVKRLAADLERARNKHASKSKKLGAALLEAAGEGREYVEKPPPEELPTFFQEIVQSVTPTKKQVILLCVLAVISLSAMFLAPRRYLPQAVMMSLLCSTLVFAVYTALTMEEEDKDDAKKTK
ncbi:unnamed protein product [Effrenium voratum]|uniref:Uncharacterized protein n=1 Tax=Effrenium voratum TaxID=2562239 RepID=A0AA36JSH3_9DINO|nr:unnamed protein product [Effrenium voratum]